MNKEKINNTQQQEAQTVTPYTTMERFGYVLAVLIILAGAYALCSVLFYFAHWKADYSLLIGAHLDNPNFESFSYGNICGGLGARIGEMLIGRSFGVAGVIIPIYLILFGVNIFRHKKLMILNRDTLTMALILILSSLTLGCAFGSMWNIFHSGLGGEFGVAIADQLIESIGIGTLFLLIGAWIALGVYINSNFINVVNKAGSKAINSGDKIISMIKRDKGTCDDTQETEEVSDDENNEPQEVAEVEQASESEESQVNEEAIEPTDSPTEKNPIDEFITSEIPLEIEVATASEDDPIA